MSPSSTRRRGRSAPGAISSGALSSGAIVTGVLVGAAGLGIGAAGPAAALTVGPVTTCPAGQVLSSLNTCVHKTVRSLPVPHPSASAPSLPKVSVPRLASGSGSKPSGGLPTLPPTGSTGSGSGGSGSSTSGSGTTSSGRTTTTTTAKPTTTPASTTTDGLLTSASAYLPAAGILDFSTLSGSGTGGTLPTSSYLGGTIPSPVLAQQPASTLAAVQAPLLAAGEEASRGGSVLTGFRSKALPGLLVALATAVVAVVGVGNVRVWQARRAR